MPLEGLEEEGLPCNPDLSLAQKKFLLTLTDNAEKKESLATEILTVIKEKAMAPFYASLCQDLHLELGRALLEELQKINKVKLEEVDASLQDAEKNFGDMETRDAHMTKAEYLTQIGDTEEAITAFCQAYDKTVALGYRMDVVFYLLRIGLFYCNHELIRSNLEKAQSLVEEGGDWNRRNRLKVYRGVYAMQICDFKTAATNFFDAVATFTSTELPNKGHLGRHFRG